MLQILLQIAKTHKGPDPVLVAIFIFAPWVLVIGYLIYHKSFSTKWEQGVFPSHLRYNRDNLMEAYICLAARMIQSNPEDAGEKVIYMNKYFNKYFPDSHYDFSESLSFSYKNPIKIWTVTNWLRNKLPYRKQRLQIMYFLAGMAVVDGQLNTREVRMLQELSELLELTKKEFDAIISMYTQRHRRTQESNRKSVSTKESLIELASRILGVSPHASMDEIKKAYRSLVKKHHPDRFVDESQEQQDIAEERFLEIQKAYETLEKLK